MKNTRCAICETTDNSRELYPARFRIKNIHEGIFSARRMPDKIHYRVVKCKSCGLVRSDPVLDEKEINDWYRKSSFTYQNEIKNISATYKKYLKKAATHTHEFENFLEIGCGNGFFLEVAQAFGFKNVYGVEPSKEAIRKSHPRLQKLIVNEPFKPNLFKKNTFDCICMFQVFDHFSQPNDVLKECYRILKDNGIILAINHDVRSYQSILLGEKSPIIDIEHHYLYDKVTTKKIYEKNNFEIIDIFDIENIYSMGYWNMLFPFPQKIKFLLLNTLKRLNFHTIPVKCKAGNLGVIARKV